MPDMTVLGLDIGGANIKLASNLAQADSFSFPLWKRPDELAQALTGILHNYPRLDGLAITMTGELADCFATKREGVEHIVQSVGQAVENCVLASRLQPDLPVAFLSFQGFVSCHDALQAPLQLAASNWWGSGLCVSRQYFRQQYLPDTSVDCLIDCGSTTTDILPLGERHTPATDLQRLAGGRLIYTGVRRSSIAGILNEVSFPSGLVRTANEYFATAEDAHILLGNSIGSANAETADGCDQSIDSCARRLARMVCADVDELGSEKIYSLASQIEARQIALIGNGLEQLRLVSPVEVGLNGAQAAIASPLDRESGTKTRAIRGARGEATQTERPAPNEVVPQSLTPTRPQPREASPNPHANIHSDRLAKRPTFFVCGEGEFLAASTLRRYGVAERQIIRCSQVISPSVSASFPAFAIANLAAAHFQQNSTEFSFHTASQFNRDCC